MPAQGDEHHHDHPGADPRAARQWRKQPGSQEQGAQVAVRGPLHEVLDEQEQTHGHRHHVAEHDGLAGGDTGTQRASTAQVGLHVPLQAQSIEQGVVQQPVTDILGDPEQRQEEANQDEREHGVLEVIEFAQATTGHVVRQKHIDVQAQHLAQRVGDRRLA